jgi:hypothetical protein
MSVATNRRREHLRARPEITGPFGRRCILAGRVARRSNTAVCSTPRALPARRLGALGGSINFGRALTGSMGRGADVVGNLFCALGDLGADGSKPFLSRSRGARAASCALDCSALRPNLAIVIWA